MPEDPTPPKKPEQPAAPDAAAKPVEPAESAATAAPSKPVVDSTLPTVIPVVPDTGYTPDGVPTFEGVREKIESRYGTAIGATELAEETTESRTAAQQFDARQKAAEEKLAEIRASMHKTD